MIDINELRIGNLVYTNGKPDNTSNKGIYKVLAIVLKDMNLNCILEVKILSLLKMVKVMRNAIFINTNNNP